MTKERIEIVVLSLSLLREKTKERSEIVVLSLFHLREGRKTSLCQALEQSRLERPLKTRIRR